MKDFSDIQQFIDTLINGPARYTQEHNLSDGWTLVVVIGALLLEFGVALSAATAPLIPLFCPTQAKATC